MARHGLGPRRPRHPPRRARPVRHGRPRLHDHHAPAGVEVLRSLRPVRRSDGRLPRVEEAPPLRPSARALGGGQGPEGLRDHPRRGGGGRPEAARAEVLQGPLEGRGPACLGRRPDHARQDRSGRLRQGARPDGHGARHADRAARLQPDVPDHDRRARRRGGPRFPPPGDCTGHLCELQECDRQHASEAPGRDRAGGQELPQRDHAPQLHLPLARVRADGDRVLLPTRGIAGVVQVLARPPHEVVARDRPRR